MNINRQTAPEMIDTIILQPENKRSDRIINLLETYCPTLKINQVSNFQSFASDTISDDHGHIIFYDLPAFTDFERSFIRCTKDNMCSTILISPKHEHKYLNSFKSISGIINRPIYEAEFVITVNNAINKLELEQRLKDMENENKETFPKDIIGIPTMEGYEYLKIENIIRFEGIQRCTRIVSTGRDDIISAYPIGQFKSLLKGHSFYLSHKSHLINLKNVVRYSREGFICLNDSSRVPLARRNKGEFIAQWNHI